jgi:oligopeptide/dipeptide ABC transporter ATP-binding protein
MATLLITHDLALARAHADRIVVMHAGQIVETAPAARLFDHPSHPYTRCLIGATPDAAATVADLVGIVGSPPNLASQLPGCRFAGRCSRMLAACAVERPPLTPVAPEHKAACWNPT